MNIPNIPIRTFYGAGAILMSISTFGGIWNAVVIWEGLNFGSKLSTVMGILFTMMFVGLFATLYKISPGQQPKIINSPEIDELLTKLKEEPNGKSKKRSRR